MEEQKYVWRFGYGSNIGLNTLRYKKNLNPTKYLVGTIEGWELYFKPSFSKYVEPAFAGIRPKAGAILHGSAFYIPQNEADDLDSQEAGYDVLESKFITYDGNVVMDTVGLYVPKGGGGNSSKEAIPSLRYLRLLRNGAREGGLAEDWIRHLDSFPHYVTPPEVRSQTKKWISEFHNDDDKDNKLWTAEELAKYDGTTTKFPVVHTSVMEYVLQIPSEGCWIFPSWKGHNVMRRNLLQFRGKSLDTNDIRYDQPGYRPIPKFNDCTEEEQEYLLQNLETLLHRGSNIVGRFKPYLDDQKDNNLLDGENTFAK